MEYAHHMVDAGRTEATDAPRARRRASSSRGHVADPSLQHRRPSPPACQLTARSPARREDTWQTPRSSVQVITASDVPTPHIPSSLLPLEPLIHPWVGDHANHAPADRDARAGRSSRQVTIRGACSVVSVRWSGEHASPGFSALEGRARPARRSSASPRLPLIWQALPTRPGAAPHVLERLLSLSLSSIHSLPTQ